MNKEKFFKTKQREYRYLDGAIYITGGCDVYPPYGKRWTFLEKCAEAGAESAALEWESQLEY